MGASTITERELVNAVIHDSCGAWMQSYGKIWAKDRTKGLVTPKLNYLQRKIQSVVDRFEGLELPCRILGLKPRARGSTTMFTALGYTALRRSSTSAVFIGGQSDQTVGLWNMMKTYHSSDTFQWGNTGEVNEKGAHFTNGSRAKKETARDVQSGIGDTYGLLHATEVARWSQYGVSNASAVMSNILKAVPLLAGTFIFLESTAEQAGGDFYDRWNSATDAEVFLSGDKDIEFGSYCRLFAGWFEFEESSLKLTPVQKEHIQKTLDADEEWAGEKELIDLYGRVGDDGVTRLGESVQGCDVWDQLAWRRYAIREECDRDLNVFNRDYPHCAEVAFQKSGRMRFNATGVGILRKRLAKHPATHGMIEEVKERQVSFRQSDMNEAQFSIFEKPQPGRRYIVSVDPATGASQTTGLDPDNHGIFCLRAGYYDTTGKWVRPATVARVVPCKWEIDLAAMATWKLARFYGGVSGVIIVVEVNMDRGMLEHLKAFGANLYVREHFNRREQKLTGALGYLTTTKSRETLITTLATAIREWETPGAGIDIWCPHAVAECENFITKDDGRSEAGQGSHDDSVFSIALGLELIEQATICPPPLNLFSYLDPHGAPRQSAAVTPSGYS